MFERKDSEKFKNHNIPMALACVLFAFVLVSTHFTSGLYAKYTVSDWSGDGARVAAFGHLTLTETIDGEVMARTTDPLPVAPGANIAKKVTVDFSGREMDVYIFVGITQKDWTVSGVNDPRVFTAGTAVDGEGNNVPILTWTVGDGWKFLTEENNEYVYYIHLDSNIPLNQKDVIKELTDHDDYYISVSEWATEDDIAALGTLAPGLDFRAAVVQAGGFPSVTEAWDAVK